ncbi:Rpn family recombination-promoting nuclease/putative transposase [Pseudoduganella sp.]|uniref:Rpn family recombination-promoting nuclease/putative transposase n=1 Tax=Pseudoduganella sp. TaxID=1880898 RepID=UPI0035AFC8AA
MSTNHDSAFRALFAHPEIVKDLLQGFLPSAWSADFEFDTLERVNGSYVGDAGEQRHSDMVWRLRMQGDWLYLYVLLEFQSSPDPWMALRMQVYLGLLYQDLVKRHETPTRGKLPPVVPVVLYTGARKGLVKEQLRELIMPPRAGLDIYQAAQRYVLIDLRRASRRFHFSLDNLLGALALMAYVVPDEWPIELAQRFEQWLQQAGGIELRRTVMVWLQTRLPAADSRHTLEWKQIAQIEEADVANIRNGMPLFPTFVEQFAWGYEQNAKQKLLERQLRKRFGEIPAAYAVELGMAGPVEFDAWFDRLIDGKSLDEIFAPIPDVEEDDFNWYD